MGREELIHELNEGFDALAASMEGLNDEQLTQHWYGDWGVREIAAHVAGWHWEMEQALMRIARGERPVPEGVDYNDADAWNAKFAAGVADMGPDEVVEDLRASKEAFVAAARRVPEDRFEEGRAANRILHTSAIDHYQEHEPPIREWRQREGI
ncbi:MAG: ClbS/DfsB family four-helix bundle protein [Chloroflexi bacterium]|nr:MAG: ClbS/DfsB family four-helix bundle protein [Chloroflexota bacterium]